MPYLVAAVVFVGALGLLNLLLGVAVMARLREHAQQIAKLGDPARRPGTVSAGDSVEAFSAVTTSGEPVARERLADGTLVAFFSPGCPSCVEQAAELVRHAPDWPGGRDAVLSVVIADPGQDVSALVGELEPVSKVVVERNGGPLMAAFRVDSIPAMCVVDGFGVVLASGGRMEQVLVTQVTQVTRA
ncbi:hypothetical protein [Planobispora longispora]|uniref:Thioredoxin domain-containing protein n=1 Tax=Planobispora longispora TaxID=28887 RepID=A0A8J3W282_9ACTN|nr:hypothetical protein [Planobispora longispora]BFE89035.1 hypothetical protein GCM10020093_116360 [Planobispora longispora]GIH74074.1 hypothetical protein Plo01_05030 [Planobispora longispora]